MLVELLRVASAPPASDIPATGFSLRTVAPGLSFWVLRQCPLANLVLLPFLLKQVILTASLRERGVRRVPPLSRLRLCQRRVASIKDLA